MERGACTPMPYLFVHFREKATPDGEQVYFGLSRDAFHWEQVNEGRPVLWAYYGDKGVRDHTITRSADGKKFYILSTDLCLCYGMRDQYHRSWEEIGRKGSHFLSLWESEDLVHWTEQRLIPVGTDRMGCCWAPDILAEKDGSFLLHWSSPVVDDDYAKKRIFYRRTRDFASFSDAEQLYEKPDADIIDSAMYEEDGVYYLFVKSAEKPSGVILLRADTPTGPFTRVEAFDEAMKDIHNDLYEAPTAVRTEDGRWCLFLDYYGVRGAGQGYVPFVADSLREANFRRADAEFSFPYGFKHGTILKITDEEYERIRSFDFAAQEQGSPC